MRKQFLVCLLSSTAIFLSACQDEQEKMDEVQKVALIQGLKTATLFKSQLATYYAEHQTCNERSISSNDRVLTKRHYVQDVQTTEACQIILTFKNDPTTPDLARKKIFLTMHPSNSTFNWSCTTNISRSDLLPEECQ